LKERLHDFVVTPTNKTFAKLHRNSPAQKVWASYYRLHRRYQDRAMDGQNRYVTIGIKGPPDNFATGNANTK
jgi:hypothetical protein